MIIKDKRQLHLIRVVLAARLFLVFMCLKCHTFVKIKIIIKTMIIKITLTNNLLVKFRVYRKCPFYMRTIYFLPLADKSFNFAFW